MPIGSTYPLNFTDNQVFPSSLQEVGEKKIRGKSRFFGPKLRSFIFVTIAREKSKSTSAVQPFPNPDLHFILSSALFPVLRVFLAIFPRLKFELVGALDFFIINFCDPFFHASKMPMLFKTKVSPKFLTSHRPEYTCTQSSVQTSR